MAKKLRDFQGPASFILPQSDTTGTSPQIPEPITPQISNPLINHKPATYSITLDDILFKPAVHHRDAATKFVGAYIPEKYHNILKELSNISGIPAKFIIANILSNFLEADGKASLLAEIENLQKLK